MDGWFLILVFWPSLAILIALIVVWKQIEKIMDTGYKLGKKHGKEEAYLDIAQHALENFDDLRR